MAKAKIVISKNELNKFKNACEFTGCNINFEQSFGEKIKLEVDGKPEALFDLGRSIDDMADTPVKTVSHEPEAPKTENKFSPKN